MTRYNTTHSPALEGCRDRVAALEAENARLREARDEAAELRAALRTLIHDLEALMEESHLSLYDGDGWLVSTSWGKVLQGGKDEYLSNWREAKRLAGGERDLAAENRAAIAEQEHGWREA